MPCWDVLEQIFEGYWKREKEEGREGGKEKGANQPIEVNCSIRTEE